LEHRSVIFEPNSVTFKHCALTFEHRTLIFEHFAVTFKHHAAWREGKKVGLLGLNIFGAFLIDFSIRN
jgi:hypothetical protein